MINIMQYINIRYANIIIPMLRDKFVEQFPYMESCNMGLILPEKYQTKLTIPPHLISPLINEGGVIKW